VCKALHAVHPCAATAGTSEACASRYDRGLQTNQTFFDPHMQCYCFAATAFSVSTATKAVKAIAVKQPCEQQQLHHHQQQHSQLQPYRRQQPVFH
jgi:hypothetical protein